MKAVITGATKGIGKAIAQLFLEKGVDIAKSELIPYVSFWDNFFTNFSNQAKVPNDFIRGDPTLQNVKINGDAATICFPSCTPTDIAALPYSDQINENNSFGFG